MTIEEKYLELRKKSVNRKNNRYLFTYLENRPKSRLYIALFKRRNKPQNVLNISRDSSNMACDMLSTKQNCVCLMKSLKNMPESLKTMTDSVRLCPLL